MKKFLFLVAGMAFFGCEQPPKNASEIDLENKEHRISYALGADMASTFSNIPDDVYAELELDAVEEGFHDLLTDEKGKTDDCRDVLQKALSQSQGIDTTENSYQEISHCYGSMFGEMLRKSLTTKNAMKRVDLNIAEIGFSSALHKNDTLIPLEERQKMIANWNDDLNLMAGKDFMVEKTKEFAESTKDEGYVLVEDEAGNGEKIDLGKEYEIKYTLTNIVGDTIISTITDPNLSDEANAQVVNAEDVVFPEVWKLAAEEMEVGGDYTIYAPHDLAFGEDGLMRPNDQGYVVPPNSAIVVHSKVLGQYPLNSRIKERGKELIEAAKQEPNTKVGESGYVLTTLEEGDGPKVKPGSDVQAHYILKNSKGKTVENSYMSSMQNNEPAPSFSLKGVVDGWKKAVPEMRKGGRYKLVLPYDLAYGESGNQGIAPYETLEFEMEILDFGEPGSLVQPRQQRGGGQQQQISQEQLKQLQKQMKQQQQ
ncbi:MAG: FKBP-type peptidyl-prolyl cis-trans isomerase [Bacteroidota bacterium]